MLKVLVKKWIGEYTVPSVQGPGSHPIPVEIQCQYFVHPENESDHCNEYHAGKKTVEDFSNLGLHASKIRINGRDGRLRRADTSLPVMCLFSVKFEV